jgi:hypothetical protein
MAKLAAADASPVVRLYLASALQRIEPALRWPILEGLVAREEDAQDPNLPLMIWYGLEPLVTADKDRALKIGVASRIPILRQYVVRRLAGGETTPPGAGAAAWTKTLKRVAPAFSVNAVGEGEVQYHAAFRNRLAVQTHPVNQTTPCVLRGEVEIPADKKAKLRVRVSHHPHGDWQLVVKANGKVLLDQIIGPATVKNEWADLEIDLAAFAGGRVKIELENRANNWSNEWAYWNEVALVLE